MANLMLWEQLKELKSPKYKWGGPDARTEP